MKATLSNKKNIRRAVLGGAVALTGAAVAYKSPVLRARALAAMTAGVATAAGYGTKSYEFVKDQAERRAHAAEAIARQWKDHAVMNVQQSGGSAIAGLVDLPFSYAEGLAGASIDKRVKRIESLLADRLSGYQAEVTGSAIDRARKLAKLPIKDAEVSKRTRLRREVENKKWNDFLGKLQWEAIRTGRQVFNLDRTSIQKALAESGLTQTEQNMLTGMELYNRVFPPTVPVDRASFYTS